MPVVLDREQRAFPDGSDDEREGDSAMCMERTMLIITGCDKSTAQAQHWCLPARDNAVDPAVIRADQRGVDRNLIDVFEAVTF